MAKILSLNPAQIQLLEQRGYKVSSTKPGDHQVSNPQGQKLNPRKVAELLQAANQRATEIDKLATREARRTTQTQLAEAEKTEKAIADLELMQTVQAEAATTYQQFLDEHGIKDGQYFHEAAEPALVDQQGSLKTPQVGMSRAILDGVIARLKCNPRDFQQIVIDFSEYLQKFFEAASETPEKASDTLFTTAEQFKQRIETESFHAIFVATEDPIAELEKKNLEIKQREEQMIKLSHQARDYIIRLIGKGNGPVKLLEGTIITIQTHIKNCGAIAKLCDDLNPHKLKQILKAASNNDVNSALNSKDAIAAIFTRLASMMIVEAAAETKDTVANRVQTIFENLNRKGQSIANNSVNSFILLCLEEMQKISKDLDLTRSQELFTGVASFIKTESK